MSHKKYKKKISLSIMLLLLCVFSVTTVLAETLPGRSATAEGLYRHPETGVIEDSGGDAQEALGQSMVTNVVDPQAYVETDPAGGFYLSVRFHLMDSISKVTFTEQEPGETEWKDTAYEETARGEDQADLRLHIDSEATIVRAECFVDAMGRSVLFFITAKDFVDGNAGGFTQMENNDAIKTETAETNETGTTGLTIGGENKDSGAQNSEEAVQLTVSKGETIQMQQLNLSGGVWWMLFLIVFCATILGNLAIMAIKILIRKNTYKKVKNHNQHNEWNEKEEDFAELSEVDIDWEAPDDGNQ